MRGEEGLLLALVEAQEPAPLQFCNSLGAGLGGEGSSKIVHPRDSSQPRVQVAASPGKQLLLLQAAEKPAHHHVGPQECAPVWVSVDNPDSSPPEQLIKTRAGPSPIY